MKKRLLCLGTSNSARSQMAEGLLRHWGDTTWDVASAGVEPAGVHELATLVMGELGIDIAGQQCQPLTKPLLESADLIITLCGDAKERCPLTPGKRRQHWPLPDPARVTGAREKQLRAFREVRDALVDRVRLFLSSS